MRNLINRVRDAWLAAPEWVRKSARAAAIGVFVAVSALNLAIPNTLPEAKAEGLTVFTTAALIVLAVIKVEVLPNLVPWLIGSTKKAILTDNAITAADAAKEAR